MLYFDVHDPVPNEPHVPNRAYLSIARHKIVEDFLTKRGWECEVPVRNWFNVRGRWIKGVGRIDGLSPSKIVLEIKTGKPRKCHLLQTGYYQLHVPLSPGVILLYSNGSEYHKNLRPLAKQYLPKVTGCVLSPFTPPLHPNFPHCLRQCVYFNRCRYETAPAQTERSEWSVWYTQIRIDRSMKYGSVQTWFEGVQRASQAKNKSFTLKNFGGRLSVLNDYVEFSKMDPDQLLDEGKEDIIKA